MSRPVKSNADWSEQERSESAIPMRKHNNDESLKCEIHCVIIVGLVSLSFFLFTESHKKIYDYSLCQVFIIETIIVI